MMVEATYKENHGYLLEFSAGQLYEQDAFQDCGERPGHIPQLKGLNHLAEC